MAGSLLRTVGLPELVTDTLQDYEELAVRLATDKPGAGTAPALAGESGKLSAVRYAEVGAIPGRRFRTGGAETDARELR